MGLKCSLLGHDFETPEVEREREEQGSEVVVTVREVKACRRCSLERVVGENKEVTAINARTPGDEDGSATRASGTGETGSDAPTAGAADSDAAGGASESAAQDEQDRITDDGIILDADDDVGRTPGEWPEHDDVGVEDIDRSDAPREWPETAGEDEGFDAEPSDGTAADVDLGGGLTPTSADSARTGGRRPRRDREDDLGITRAGEPASGRAIDDDVETEYFCPECGLTQPSAASSLRAGDICPDCRSGYLGERER